MQEAKQEISKEWTKQLTLSPFLKPRQALQKIAPTTKFRSLLKLLAYSEPEKNILLRKIRFFFFIYGWMSFVTFFNSIYIVHSKLK